MWPDLTVVSFTAFGTPAAQGSKVRTKHGGIRETSKRLTPWRAEIARAAAEAMRKGAPISSTTQYGTTTGFQNNLPLITGPVEVKCWFWFPRPKTQYGTGKNVGTLKNSAPRFYAQAPDIDKLSRAVLDGITGIVVRNDAQVVGLNATKVWGEPARAVIEIRELNSPPPAPPPILGLGKPETTRRHP